MTRYFATLTVHALMYGLTLFCSFNLGSQAARRIPAQPALLYLLLIAFIVHVFISSSHALAMKSKAAIRVDAPRKQRLTLPERVEVEYTSEAWPDIATDEQLVACRDVA